MSSEDSSGVTLALVDPSLLSSWEEMVKRGVECSLTLKHSKGKITAMLQCTTPASSSAPSSTSSAEKKKKKRKRNKEKSLKALLDYHQRLVVEKGLPPSRLMEQQAAAAAAVSPAPVPEPGQVSGEAIKCDQCDFVSKSTRGLKTHTSRAHKVDKTEGLREPEEVSVSPSASPILDTSREEVREEKEEPVSPLQPPPSSPPSLPCVDGCCTGKVRKHPCMGCFSSKVCPYQCGFPGYPR